MEADVAERFTRLEGVVEALADHVLRLDDVMATLAEANIESIKRFNALSQEMQQRGRETDERIRTLAEETAQRFRETGERLDERIDHLVSAIGELTRRQPRAS